MAIFFVFFFILHALDTFVITNVFFYFEKVTNVTISNL